MSTNLLEKKSTIQFGIIAGILFYILEIVVDIWFGSLVPNYDWTKESVSHLGESSSPVVHLVLVWGIVFCVLLLLFSNSFYQVFNNRKWVRVGTIFIILYGLGEGLGSGLFPINPIGTPVTLSAQLHNVFSGMGDTGIVLLPFVLMVMFPKSEHQNFRLYLWSVVAVGLTMASFFLIAKYYAPDNFILNYKGVWQRIYMLNYHTMLLVMCFKMKKKII